MTLRTVIVPGRLVLSPKRHYVQLLFTPVPTSEEVLHLVKHSSNWSVTDAKRFGNVSEARLRIFLRSCCYKI